MTRKTWFKMSISVLLTAVLILLSACGSAGNNADGKQKVS